MELGGRRVMEGAEDFLENCANMKVNIEVLERLIEPDNLEISLRYILKYSTRGGSNVFYSSSTHQRNRATSWQSEKRWLEGQGKTVHSKRVGKTSGMILSIKE